MRRVGQKKTKNRQKGSSQCSSFIHSIFLLKMSLGCCHLPACPAITTNIPGLTLPTGSLFEAVSTILSPQREAELLVLYTDDKHPGAHTTKGISFCGAYTTNGISISAAVCRGPQREAERLVLSIAESIGRSPTPRPFENGLNFTAESTRY